MLSIFDWIRRCRTGGELVATLEHFERHSPDTFPEIKALAGPTTLDQRPCARCWLYPVHERKKCSKPDHCQTCGAIVGQARIKSRQSYLSSVIWGNVNTIPRHMEASAGFYEDPRVLRHVIDENHFLLVLNSRKIKAWLQELMLYHGSGLKGLIQIFPTTGRMKLGGMGELICRASHYDARFPMDRLRIRFYRGPKYLSAPHKYENKGVMTWYVGDFIKMLDMAAIFRSLIRPEEQEILRKITQVENESEAKFLWGRMMTLISPEAKDMLNSWNFRDWSNGRIDLFYGLFDYVEYTA